MEDPATNATLLSKLMALPPMKMVPPKQAAGYLGYTPEHLRRLACHPMKDNVLPRVKMGNGRVFYLVSDLKKFIEKREALHGY